MINDEHSWRVPIGEMCDCRRYGPGLSAKAILSRGRDGIDYPRDPSDLCRCLAVAPVAPEHMRGLSREWSVLVAHWDELAKLLKREHPRGRAPKTYARMRKLFVEARAVL